MQNGGKKWSGLRSNSILFILFFFQREMERKRNARWKSKRIRTTLLSHRRQNEEDDKEALRVVIQRPYLEQSA